MTPTRIVRLIGIAGLIGWFGMVGWVAKTTQAQNGGALPLPSAPAGSDPSGAVPPQSNDLPQPMPREQPPAPPVEGFKKQTELPSVTGPAKYTEAAPPAIGQGELMPHAAAAEPVTSEGYGVAAPSTEDPEKSAQRFAERSRREAEAHLKALTTEAAQLRARLAKLESGIKRWQTLVNALKGTQGSSLSEDSPSDLEPLPQAAAADPRADKRVKWATASPPATADDPIDSSAPGAAPAPVPYARPATAVAPGLLPR
jgi:hypothetical protein